MQNLAVSGGSSRWYGPALSHRNIRYTLSYHKCPRSQCFCVPRINPAHYMLIDHNSISALIGCPVNMYFPIFHAHTRVENGG